MLSIINYWTKTLNLKKICDYNNVYMLNKIKANSAAFENTIIFFIRSVTFFKIKKISANLSISTRTVAALVLVTLMLLFVISGLLLCF